jgi:hypothetical protein
MHIQLVVNFLEVIIENFVRSLLQLSFLLLFLLQLQLLDFSLSVPQLLLTHVASPEITLLHDSLLDLLNLPGIPGVFVVKFLQSKIHNALE